MSLIAKKEISVIISLFFIISLVLVPALIYARRELWDGIQINQLSKIKEKLEQYNNKHSTYPLEFKTPPFTYVVTAKDQKDATAWFLRAQMKNSLTPRNGFDKEEGRNYYYRIVRDGKKTYYDICGGTFTCGVTLKK